MGVARVLSAPAAPAAGRASTPTLPGSAVGVFAVCLGVCLAAARLSPAVAQQPPRLTVIGAGAAVSCAEWASAGSADPELERWAFGFASAVAAGVQVRRGGDPLASLDAGAIHAWLGDHCRRRPDEMLTVALVRMVLAAAR